MVYGRYSSYVKDNLISPTRGTATQALVGANASLYFLVLQNLIKARDTGKVFNGSKLIPRITMVICDETEERAMLCMKNRVATWIDRTAPCLRRSTPPTNQNHNISVVLKTLMKKCGKEILGENLCVTDTPNVIHHLRRSVCDTI